MTTKTVYLTGSGTWTVPYDFDPVNNSLNAIAAGADGTGGGTNTSGASGGGGQWAGLTGAALTPGASIAYQAGVRNGTRGIPGAPGTGDSWISSSTFLFAQAASGISGGNYLLGAWSRNKGGEGRGVTTSSDGGGHGGGGAAGPNGPGMDGGGASTGANPADTSGAGGGAANGGSAGANNDSATGKGGVGGDGRLGSGGGVGGAYPDGPGGDGDLGGGGAGGSGTTNGVARHAKGGKGGLDPVWSPTKGPGGGGGGGGPWLGYGNDGGDGGGYGAGGGAGAPRGITGGPVTSGGLGTSGLIVITYTSTGASPTPPVAPTLQTAPRLGVILRIATDPVIRIWSGLVRDIAIPSGGAETTDGAIYRSMGLLGGLPQLSAALNGEAERVDFALSGVAVTGEVAALAADNAADIRGVAVDVGLILFDADWQLAPPVYWVWSGTADSLTVERGSDAVGPTRTLKLSAASVFSGRRRANPMFFTDIDQKHRSGDDDMFDQVANYYSGSTKVWGVG